eukprot:CAMPEP_0167806854 /NCGR_PEP_ID=MMETSP0111_2-20121227/22119_1 /TAXON_ID=91324 /ORGANISM="Lotharella globosa, Strain CCCM811" /LENGTH=54 /DNA_ID=CAMNT_0007704473 /DNA_START=1 /DNA_END=165 /DNA_ORIENTATION=-
MLVALSLGDFPLGHDLEVREVVFRVRHVHDVRRTPGTSPSPSRPPAAPSALAPG